MGDEPRRSGRATKGQHKNSGDTPSTTTTPTNQKPKKGGAQAKASKKNDANSAQTEEDDGEDDDIIRCVCGNSDSDDKRAFIQCDTCEVWQHNVCMGMSPDEDDLPDHYYCEDCNPQDHRETLQAMKEGRNVWEERTEAEMERKKRKKGRKSVGKGGLKGRASEVKSDKAASSSPAPATAPTSSAEKVEEQVASAKRKRNEVKEEVTKQDNVAETTEAAPAEDEQPVRSAAAARADKRRKPSAPDMEMGDDPKTAIVPLEKLPKDRHNVAIALIKIMVADLKQRIVGSYRIPDGYTADSLGTKHGLTIEYALSQNHGATNTTAYSHQFRALFANLKKNKLLIERLLSGSLTADELSTMSTDDMADEEVQRMNAELKAANDKQLMMLQDDDGPRVRRTHKGDEYVDEEKRAGQNETAPTAQLVRHRDSVNADDEMGGIRAASPPHVKSPGTLQLEHHLSVDTSRPQNKAFGREISSQQFDVNAIWSKTQQSPVAPSGQPVRPMQQAPRRRSSMQPQAQQDGTQEDPDVDRMLEDTNDDSDGYSPEGFNGDGSVVWRGQLVQQDHAATTVNARFIAGRDITSSIPWNQLLPDKLQIDGRLGAKNAEEYLCDLQWSTSSDVTVLALTPYDDAASFAKIFDYFHNRKKYAVVEKGKPALAKDLYIVPMDVGAGLTPCLEKLKYCVLDIPVQERMLLAVLVVHREHTGSEQPAPFHGDGTTAPTNNGHTPGQVRGSVAGPAASPINPQGPAYSPVAHHGGFAGQYQPQQQPMPMPGYGNPPSNSPFPPNPYSQPTQASSGPQQHDVAYYPQSNAQPPQVPHPNPLVAQILGEYANMPTAQQLLLADPQMDRARMETLRQLLEEVPECRFDMNALGKQLGAN